MASGYKTRREWADRVGAADHQNIVAVGLWGDEAPFTSNDKLLMVLWNCISTKAEKKNDIGFALFLVFCIATVAAKADARTTASGEFCLGLFGCGSLVDILPSDMMAPRSLNLHFVATASERPWLLRVPCCRVE
eukprot:3760601-Pyramimonas_sp.AAC.1